MKKTLPLKLLFVLFILGLSNATIAQRIKYHRIEAEIEPQQLEYLLQNGLEVDHFGYEDKLHFTGELSDGDLAILKKNKIDFKYLIKDLEKNYQKINEEIDRKNAKLKVDVTTPTNFALGSYAGFFTLTELNTILDQMHALYPNLISAKTSIGNSVEGRPLYMVKISDNPDQDESEPEICLNAVHHAREPMSMSQLIFFMWHLLENYNTDKEIKTLLNSSEIYIIPCVNPDGYVYNYTTNPNGGGMWRKNRKNNGNGTYGVDLNRNYGYKWGLDNVGSSGTTSSETYRGTSGFSEVETTLMRNFYNQRSIVSTFSFHSYGNYCINPNEWEKVNTNPEKVLLGQMGSYFTVENGFKTGNVWETLAYLSNGGAGDWLYHEQTTKGKIYGFTPEVGASTDGFWPASSRIIPLSNSTIDMNKKLLRVSTYYGKATPNGSPSFNTLSSSVAFQFQNFSVKPATYTVSLTAISPEILSVGTPKTYSNFTMLQTQADAFSFSVDPNIVLGTNVKFLLTVDNGLSAQSDTVTLNYDCGIPTNPVVSNIIATSAIVAWTGISGVNDYFVSYKPTSSTTWGAEIAVSGTNSLQISGLTAFTSYDWRVRSSCGGFSATNTFKTQCGTPASLSASALSSFGATMNWGLVPSATSYAIQYRPIGATTWTTASATTGSLAVIGLGAFAPHEFKVQATCSTSTSDFSAVANFITYCPGATGPTATCVPTKCFNETGGLISMEAENFNTKITGTGTAANRAWTTLSVSTASGGICMTTSGTGVNTANNLNGPRMDYPIYFNTAGTYYIWVRMAAGNSTTNDDSYHVGIDGVARTTTITNNGNYNSGNKNFTWVGSLNAVRVSVVIPTTGYHTVNVWMREDGTRIDKIILSNSSTFTPTSTGNAQSASCNTPVVANARATNNANSEVTFKEDLNETIDATAYPNPFTDEIVIDFKQSKTTGMNLRILDMQGKEVHQQTLSESERQVVLNPKNLPAGNYLIDLRRGNRKKVLRVNKNQ